MLALAIHMDGEAQILAGLEKVQLFLEQQRVGTHVDILLARDQAFDDFVDLGVKQRFAAGNGDGGRAAFIGGLEALFGAHVLLQDMSGILDFAAARASKIAAEKRLQHER